MSVGSEGQRPLLAITMGDIAGIGPEIIAKALGRASVFERCRPLVIGDESAMRTGLDVAESFLTLNRVADPAAGRFEQGTVDLYQPGESARPVPIGEVSEEAGAKSVDFVEAAVELCRKDVAQGIVTAPLNKAATRLAGCEYPGHTELLAARFGVVHYALVLTARERYFFHITTHVALRDAIGLVTTSRTLATIRLAAALARALGWEDEPIAVAGLNPHAGEGGLFGNEERVELLPAIEQARAEGIHAVGPLPADALIPQAVQGRYRFVLACYHDQGHVPFKAVYGDEGVNITVGLPVVRTSVDHGTAFDIAGRGIAREESLLAALDQAVLLAPHWRGIHDAMGRLAKEVS